MATVTANGPGLLNEHSFMQELLASVYFGAPSQFNAINFMFKGYGPTVTISGTGISLGADGYPTGGVVSTVSYAPVGRPFSIGGLSIATDTLRALVTAGDIEGLENALLGGADTLTGTAFGDSMEGYGGADSLLGLAGDDYLIGGPGDDSVDGGVGVDTAAYTRAAAAVTVSLLAGGAQNTGGGGIDTLTAIENLSGSAFNDVLTGTGSANFLIGLDGNDTLTGRGGADRLDGGAGLDTAVFLGPSRGAVINRVGLMTVTDNFEGGVDTLTSVERLKFVDGYFNTSPLDTSAQVYRIYLAALGRTPDQSGLNNWVRAIEKGGQSIQSVANGFLGSPEFLSRFGAATDIEFMTLLYANVLHRTPDPTGLASWLKFLGTGGARAEALVGFSESKEFSDSTASGYQQGLWVGDLNAAATARLYDTMFGRLPDAAGLVSWTTALGSGTSLLQVANGFVTSTEFQATYGALGDDAFVNLMYLNVLHRGAEGQGLADWKAFLAAGHSRAEVVVGFSESNEHIANTAAHTDLGVWIA